MSGWPDDNHGFKVFLLFICGSGYSFNELARVPGSCLYSIRLGLDIKKKKVDPKWKRIRVGHG